MKENAIGHLVKWKKQSQFKPNQTQFKKSQNEHKLNFNKGLQKKQCFRSPKNKPNSNLVLSAVEWANFRKAKNERKLICYRGL